MRSMGRQNGSHETVIRLSYTRLMTGDSPVLNRPALRAALSDMPIDPPPGETSFDEALAGRQHWNLGFAERVTDEYRRFLYLAAVAGFEVTPSKFVDESWHLHLLLPHYREILCGKILGRPLDHRPGTGTREDDARCARQYEQTLALYERTFGVPAPGDIWPRPASPREWAVRWWTGNGRLLGNGIAALALFAGFAAKALGMHGLGNVFVGAGIVLGLVSFPLEALTGVGRRRKGAAGCGGGADFGTDSCGASCGGGCGGGCGG